MYFTLVDMYAYEKDQCELVVWFKDMQASKQIPSRAKVFYSLIRMQCHFKIKNY